MPRSASIDQQRTTYREMQASPSGSTLGNYEEGIPRSRLSISSTASAVHPGEVRSFNDPEGFTSCIIVEDVEPEDVFNYLSNPETLIHLSPSIICLSSKDVNFPDRQGKQAIELNITFYMHACCSCRTARTANANFRVERQTMSLYLTIQPGTRQTVMHHLTVEHYEGGTRVVNKVEMPSGVFRAFWRTRMKREQEFFLNALHDAVRGIQKSHTRSGSFPRKKKGLEAPLLCTEI